MTAVDDVSFSFDVKLGLGPKLASEVLGDVGRGAGEGSGHVHHVDDDGLDPVPLPLHFGHQPGHLVAIERVLDVSVDVESHLESKVFLLHGLFSFS